MTLLEPTQVRAPGALRPVSMPPATLVEIFERTCAEHPHATALAVDGEELSYRELDRRSQQLAARLAAAGARPGERVGVRISSGTAELYTAILAVLRAGAAYVPVDADDPEERARQVFSSADVVAVITDGAHLEVRGRARGRKGTRPAPSDDAWIIFTSGTTGAPKGVAVRHASAVAFVQAEQDLWHIGPGDRVLAGLSVSFDASCEEMWSAWASGAALVPAPRAVVRSGADLGDWMAARGVTVVSTVPTLAALWDDHVLAGIRLLILGGEALPEPLAHRLAQHCEVWNTYGPTEATVVSTAARVVPGRPVTIGEPLRGWLTAVVDDDGREVEDGQPGELVIGGVGLGRYLDAKLDQQRYAPVAGLPWRRAYRSGDIVRATPDGYAFVGRADDQVKIGGRRLELGEVESHLTSYPGVAAAAAVVRSSESGNKVLVGYVLPAAGARLDADAVRDHVAERLSGGLAPLVVILDELPLKASGKVDKATLPWPPPADAGEALEPGLAWLAERWREQLGPLPMTAESHFFALGGTSVSAAKLVSALRERFPTAAVADVYHFPRLGDLAARLEALGAGHEPGPTRVPRPLRNERRHVSALARMLGLAVVLATGSVPWVVAVLVYDDLVNGGGQARAAWWLLVPLWLVFGTLPGRAALAGVVRRVLMRGIRPGRYPRHSSVGWRLWFLDTLAQAFRLDHIGGLPWAARTARLAGLDIDPSVHLATMPPVSSLLHVGAGATIEKEVEIRGWYVEGLEIVLGEISIGAGARVAQRAMIEPGVSIGEGAEVEVGSVVIGDVPAGERWSGAPASAVGRAGDDWPDLAPHTSATLGEHLLFAGASVLRGVVPLLAALPGLAWLMMNGHGAVGGVRQNTFVVVPVLGVAYFVLRALLSALAVRAGGALLRPGWMRDTSPAAAGLWLSDALTHDAVTGLFPLFATSFTRGWLRLCGIRVGRGTEVSTVNGINRLVSIGESSFSTDDVTFVLTRSRAGWIELGQVTVGDRSFLGNGAMLRAGTRVGDDALIGLQTLAPFEVPDGTTWLGTPALEMPRRPVAADPARTLRPSRRLRAARRAFDVVRIVLPTVVASYLLVAFDGLLSLSTWWGDASMFLTAPVILLGLGLVACAFTIALKWLLVGRYKVSNHPFFSTFVWRDELINSCQEMLSGNWLLRRATGTPLVNVYLRLLGARIGRDAYIDTLAITEFDQVDVGESAVVNHHSCIQTHLFHDRVMQIGPSRLGAGSTMAPRSVVLLDAVVGDDTHLGMRSVLLRGEDLPDATRWVGVPLVAVPDVAAPEVAAPEVA